MNRKLIIIPMMAAAAVIQIGCSKNSAATYSLPKPTSYGAAIVESSGG